MDVVFSLEEGAIMITVSRLGKSFGQFWAVKDLSFNVSPGEVLGFLGPNGAGKSTTMKMISGFLTPTEGSVRIFDMHVQRNTLAAQKVMGYLPEGAPLYTEMTVSEFLGFIADVRGLQGKVRRDRLAAVLDQLSLKEVLAQTIDTLSKGFKRRVGIAQAMLHDPKVLILDEPTDGLDPNQKHQVRELIRNLSKDKIVIVSTHILEEVSAVCSRAMIIARGSLVVDDTPDGLEARSRYYGAVTVSLSSPQNSAESVFKQIAGVEQVEGAEHDPSRFTLIPKKGEKIFKEVQACLAVKGWQSSQLFIEKGRLDEVFRSLTQGGVA